GVHHIAYETDDIEGDLERIKSMGIEAIDQKPRPGLEGTLVAFLHPKSCGGVLTELVWSSCCKARHIQPSGLSTRGLHEPVWSG
ncbi:MAG TPA: hypothetical protein GX507_08190, partial [Clostridia bacterium]|nr:hypothetical protein [Clostridia bacterium]